MSVGRLSRGESAFPATLADFSVIVITWRRGAKKRGSFGARAGISLCCYLSAAWYLTHTTEHTSCLIRLLLLISVFQHDRSRRSPRRQRSLQLSHCSGCCPRSRRLLYVNIVVSRLTIGTVGIFSTTGYLGAGGAQDVQLVDIANSVLYATFALGGLVAGGITNVLGVRLTLFLGSLGYAVVSFIYRKCTG